MKELLAQKITDYFVNDSERYGSFIQIRENGNIYFDGELEPMELAEICIQALDKTS